MIVNLRVSFLLTFHFYFLIASAQTKIAQQKSKVMHPDFAIAIHGGAGNLAKRNFTLQQETNFKNKMSEALKLGYDLLEKGDNGINVVEAVIKILEDSPLFNAGKGSVFTHDGTNEMDAAIMDGKTLKAGAVAEVRTIKNPISAAKAVMEKSDFVFLSGRGAEQFAMEQQLEMADSSYFFTKERWDQFMMIRDSTKAKPDLSDTTGYSAPGDNNEKFGTVGCVVLDRYGNLAAGTSTGGIVNKRYGRIGDSPVIGAGTYANNKTCAVSCTGHGEDFIRKVAAYNVSALMEYKGLKLSEATYEIIMNKLKKPKVKGGLIAIDRFGNISMRFNTHGMFRGYADKHGNIVTHIYEKD